MLRRALLTAFLALALPCVPSVDRAEAAVAVSAQESAAIRASIIDLLANEPGLSLPVRQQGEALAAYYDGQAGPLLWIGTDRMAELIERLSDASDDGLDRADYPIGRLADLEDAAYQTDIRGQAIIELHFSAVFLEFASDLKVGRVLPRKIDPNFFLQDREIDPLAALGAAANVADLSAFFDRWQPQSPQYLGLRQGLAEYRALAAAGGWPSVPLGDTLKPGASDARVPLLRARLAVTENVSRDAPPESEQLFDDGLVEAVKSFQARHGLEVDGVVGKQTIVALNVPVEKRIESIEIAMERWRWLPAQLGDDHLFVNIAGFDLRFVRDGKLADHMAVVVGKPYHKTPIFSDAVETVEFNPYWNVPSSITFREELPKLRSNANARAALGYEVVQGNRVIPVNAIDWSRYGPGNFPFQLRQRPGPRNALGRVKLLFPNRFNVYLHDTPAHSLFSRAQRAFSHGCIRLSRPIDLAQEVLDLQGDWSRQRIDGILKSGERTVVKVKKPLPVYLTYLTAWTSDGRVNFRSDVYDHDRKLVAALAGRRTYW